MNRAQTAPTVTVTSPKLQLLADKSLRPVERQRMYNAFVYELKTELGVAESDVVPSDARDFAFRARATSTPDAVRRAVARALVTLDRETVSRKLPQRVRQDFTALSRDAREIAEAPYVDIEFTDSRGASLGAFHLETVEELTVAAHVPAPRQELDVRQSSQTVDLGHSLA